jgi:tetratricopeptide (TPR) repeat protein
MHSLKSAQSVFSELGDPRLIAWAYWHRGELLLAQDRLAEAQKYHEEALAIREQHALHGFAAESRIALAALALEQGDAQTAVRLAQQAAGHFRQERQLDNEAWALALLGQAELAQNRLHDAQQTIARAQALIDKSQNLLVRLQTLRVVAQVHAATGKLRDRKAAQEELMSALAMASASGLLAEELELRLTLYKLDRGRQTPKPGCNALCTLAKEAAAKGFTLIARKAAAAIPPSG